MKTTILRQERKQREWTLEFVSKKVGTSKQTIQRIEMLKRKPSYDVLVKLEELFNKPHIELFSIIDTPSLDDSIAKK